MIEAENLRTNLKWPLLDIEEETDSGEWLKTPNQPCLTVIEELMGLKEIMEGSKIIFRAIAHEVDTVAEADLREICQVLEEAEVDLIKVQMSADQESASRTVSRDATRCYYCKEPGHISRFCERCEDDENRLKRGSSNMMVNIDSHFETDEGYENYDDLYDEKVEYLNN